MDLDALTNKIPDMYFDWYARFIPGSIGVIAYYLLTENTFSVSTSNLVLYAFVSYLLGHISQPLVGFIVKRIESIIESDPGNKYPTAKKTAGNESLVGKVSKAHAEANSMLASALILLGLAIYLKIYLKIESCLLNVSILYFAVMTIERAFARKRKIGDLP
jgi:hypothetical protein